MRLTVADLARALQAEAWGDLDAAIIGAAEPSEAGEDHIALAMTPRYAADLRAGAVALLAPGMDPAALGLRAAIFAPRPRLAMAGLTRAFDPGPGIVPGIHPSALNELHPAGCSSFNAVPVARLRSSPVIMGGVETESTESRD